jgi:hypothetical protein
MTPETQRYLDEDATARRLNVAPRTLQRWRSTGDGPAYIRCGLRRVIYDVGAIDAWVAARTFAHRAAEVTRTSA